MNKPRVEVRSYLHTETVYLNAEGEVMEWVRNYDDAWQDTIEERDATEEEIYDYDLD
mgnify:CR=1 FL=1